MKKHYKFLTALSLAACASFAQQIIPCYTDEAMKELFARDPEAKARFEKAQHEILPVNFEQRYGNNVTNAVYYPVDTIPIVFHILHQNGAENVPDSYIAQALKEVNNIHSKRNSDTTTIDPYFQPIAGRNNYFFKLATKDPNGNCTNGIIRHFDANTDWSQTSPGYAYTGTGAGKWNPTKYLNVYIVREICQGTAPCSQSGGIVVGYTYLPGTFSSGASSDVIVYNCNFLTGTNARSLAHEIGHWLGLPHTFGNTNSPGTCMSGGQSDDFLSSGSAGAGVTDDTPKTPGAFSTCPASTPNSCDVSNYANVENIMDYASCPKMFTDGQCKRMHNTMGLATSGRNNVCTAANKIATGVRYPIICAPTANFHASARTVCPNYVITFSDSSSNAVTTQWQWSFPGGTLQSGSTLTDSMPKVSYATPGTYAVSYTASTSGGSGTITKNSYITVMTNVASYNTAWTEGFESSTLPGSDWNLYSNNNYNWVVTSAAAATGVKSAYIDNINSASGNISTLESTSFDISSFISPKLTLKLAYRQQNSANNDKLQVFTSTDCGTTWTARFTRQGSALATVTPPDNTPFVPGPANFTTYTVNINGVVGSNNVRFRFMFFADPTATGTWGNNIYIDDINLFDAAAGIASVEEQIGLNIYPNPSNGIINLGLNLSDPQPISVTVTDVLGRVVETLPSKEYAKGDVTIVLAEKKTYQSGVYFINMDVNGKRISRKVTIQ